MTRRPTIAPEKPKADPYQFWKDSLAGKNPRIVNEDPQCGFYRRRLRVGPAADKQYRWQPVAVFLDPHMVCVIDGQEVSADVMRAEWQWFGQHPITEAVYRTVEAGGKWPDIDETVTKLQKGADRRNEAAPGATAAIEGHEQPNTIKAAAEPAEPAKAPEVVLREEIETALQGIIAYRDKRQTDRGVIAGSVKIESDEASARAQTLRSALLELAGRADKDGKAIYDPPFREYKRLYGIWNTLVKMAQDGANEIRDAQTGWERTKREAAAAAAARAADEERRRNEEAQEVAKASGEAPPPPVAPVIPQSNLPEVSAQIRGGSGRAASVQNVIVAEISDFAAVAAFMLKHPVHGPRLREDLQKMANGAVRAGHQVPGAVAKEDVSVR